MPNNTIYEYVSFVKDAIRSVDAQYFHVGTINNKEFLRERVFCYELYHQMRCLQDCSRYNSLLDGLIINGEIDKRGHRDFTHLQVNPDYVIHRQGVHTDNTVVIEAKQNIKYVQKKDIDKDFYHLQKLTSSENIYKYKIGIFIAVNSTLKQIYKKFQEEKIGITFDFDDAKKFKDAKKFDSKDAKKIYVVCCTANNNTVNVEDERFDEILASYKED